MSSAATEFPYIIFWANVKATTSLLPAFTASDSSTFIL